MIESNDAELSVWGSFFHVLDLTLNCGLHTLHPGDIGDVARFTIHLLIRSIAELHEFSELSGPILMSFDGVFPAYLFRHAHWSWYIDCKDYTNLLLTCLHGVALIKNLGGRFHYVVDLVWFGNFFRLDLNDVWGKAEFTIPNLLGLLTLSYLIFTMHVEGSLATFAEDWVACSKLWSML